MLLGRHIRLRAIEREDLPAIASWFNDPETRRTIASYRPVSLADETRWLDTMSASQTDQVFLIERAPAPSGTDGEKAQALGVTGVHKIDWKNRTCVVGIVLGPSAERGKGYGSDAMHTLVKYAHGELGLHRVELEVFPTNTAAIKSYGKLGFAQEGLRRGAYFRDGKFVDIALMSVLPGELKEPA